MAKADAHFVDSGIAGLTAATTWTSSNYKTTEGDYTEFFVGFDITPLTDYYIIAKATSESALNTDFGTSGYFGYTWAGGGTASTRDAVQLSSGKLLIPHNYYKLTMVNTDGTIDTTFATSGTYTMANNITVNKVLVDSVGNFHVFGGVAAAGSNITYRKLSSNGTYLGGITAGNSSASFNDAIWADSGKTRIIACGTANAGNTADIFAINPTTADIDTDWAGNLGLGGYAQFAYPASTLYTLKLLSDGILCYQQNSVLLFKIELDGSALDTSWGTNGVVDFSNNMSAYGDCREVDVYGDDEVFVLSRVNSGGLHIYINHLDATGTVTATHEFTGAGQYTYTCLQVFNDKLILAGNGGNADNVEIWSQDFVKESGFDLAGDFTVTAITYVIPDESTKEPDVNTVTGTQSRTVQYPSDYSHLNGETVQILGDGAVYPDEVVTNGTVSVSSICSNVHAGYQFISRLLPTKLDGEVYLKRIHEIILKFYQTLGGKFGETTSSLDTIHFRKTSDEMNDSPDLFTGHIELPFDGSWNRRGDIWIYQVQPLPMTLIGCDATLDFSDD